MSQFDNLLPIILKHEGVSATNPTGLVEIPNDPGGLTKWGISQTAWSLARTRPGLTDLPASVKDLTLSQATTIYKIVYYLPIFDQLPPGPALVCFDCEVNEGNAIFILQRAMRVPDDGNFGPQSVNALRYALRDIPMFIENLLWERLASYDRIELHAPHGFLAKLWVPRLIQVRKEAMVL